MRRSVIAIFLACAGFAHAQGIIIDGTKITFPDGSMQTTAPEGGGSPYSGRTVIVSPEVDMPAASGQNLIDAIDAIATANDASANFPYLVIIEPGNYSLVDVSLTIPASVHLRGAGMDATFITSRPSGTDAVVETTDNSTIQDLTIRHVGNGSQTEGRALIAAGDNIRLQDVRVLVDGTYGSNALLVAVSTLNGVHLEMIDCIVDIVADGTSPTTVTGVYVGGAPSSLRATGTQITVNPVNAPFQTFGMFIDGSDEVHLADMRVIARDVTGGGFGAGIRAQNGAFLSIHGSRIESDANYAVDASTGGAATPTGLLSCIIGGGLNGSSFAVHFTVNTNFAVIAN